MVIEDNLETAAYFLPLTMRGRRLQTTDQGDYVRIAAPAETANILPPRL